MNIDAYRRETVRIPVKPDGSYDLPAILGTFMHDMDEIIDNHEYDWSEQARQSIALWESTFGQTERHSW